MTATSPVRIRKDLVTAAAAAADRLHRSTKAQIEYWIMLGRRVEGVVDPEKLLDVTSGTAKLNIEPAEQVTADPDALLAQLAQSRDSGAIAAAITERHPVRYRASAKYPGLLEQVGGPTGTIVVGTFRDGTFRAIEIGEPDPGRPDPGRPDPGRPHSGSTDADSPSVGKGT